MHCLRATPNSAAAHQPAHASCSSLRAVVHHPRHHQARCRRHLVIPQSAPYDDVDKLEAGQDARELLSSKAAAQIADVGAGWAADVIHGSHLDSTHLCACASRNSNRTKPTKVPNHSERGAPPTRCICCVGGHRWRM